MARKIKFKEVAHHYLGCDYRTKGSDKIYKLSLTALFRGVLDTDIKPILRRTSTLTEAERKQCGDYFINSNKVFTTDEFLYLTANGFDLFNLIDNGEADERN